MRKRYVINLIVISVMLLILNLGTSALADKGMLSINCGTPTEVQFIADQKDADVKDGMRVITQDGGYIVYRIPIGNCTPKRLYYLVSSTSYKLEYSPDGQNWSSMVTLQKTSGQPNQFSNCSNGFAPEWLKATKETGITYFRFSHLPGGKAPLTLKSIFFEVSGSPLPKGFVAGGQLPKEFYAPNPGFKLSEAIPPKLMVLVGLLAILIGRRLWRTPLKLFGLGALLWTISVAVKFAIAILLNKPVESALHTIMPKHPADVTYWIYIGLLTGITEVGIFLALTRWFQRRQWSWRDAASVGIGFGAIESILLGVGAAIAAISGFTNAGSFVPVLERALTIFIHTAATVIAIYAVTRRRWGWFVFAFLYKSGVDALAAYVLLAGQQLFASNPWFVELVYFGPFAYLAVPVMLYLRKRWCVWKTAFELPPN